MGQSPASDDDMLKRKQALVTIRDIIERHGKRISHESPLQVTERFIKVEQPWPANIEKQEKAKKEGKQPDGDEAQPQATRTSRKEISKGFAPHETNLGVAKDGVFNNDSFIPVTFLKREELSRDVRKYTFKHHQPDGVKVNTGQHFLCGFKLSDGISARPYAMTRPIGQDKEDGTFDMVVKSYFPDDKQPGGIVSNILDMMNAERGDSLLIMGSFGPIRYAGKGKFIVDQEEDGQEQTVIAKRINLISGGTGMTPIWATIKQILECDEAKIPIRFLDANTDENEILLDDELSELAENFKDQFEVIHILEEPSAKRKCEKGLVDKGKIERHLFKAEEGTITFVCGPPPMLKAAGEALKEVGFEAGKNFFHF